MTRICLGAAILCFLLSYISYIEPRPAASLRWVLGALAWTIIAAIAMTLRD